MKKMKNESNLTKTEVVERIEKPYIILKDKVYLTVMNTSEKFSFAHLKDGEIEFVEKVHYNGKDVFPNRLPLQNGELRAIVGIPDSTAIALLPTMEAEDLFEEIIVHLKKYVDAPESDIETFAYYALFTWFYQKTNTLPYLRFIGDTGKGKSRFLEVIANLCFYPVRMDGGSSGASIMRYNENWHGTLVVDESDLNGGPEDPYIKYLNLGFQKHKNIAKCKPSDYNSFDFFDPYCPKLIAMRKPFQDNATEGRLISFTPKETRKSEIPVNLPSSYENEVRDLRALIARFVLFNWDKVDGDMVYNCNPLNIEPRIQQITIPLSMVCQLLPDKEDMFNRFVSERQKEVKKVRSESLEGMVFSHICALATGDGKVPKGFEDYENDKGPIRITPKMASEGFGISSKKMTETLKSIGIRSDSNRIEMPNGEKKIIRYYVVPDEDTWNEMTQRYWYGEDVPEYPEVLKPMP
ncbi:hypothetical protein HNV12_11815 [Methanococcoides sp. SA1]|nr:hypothetical protein [Methanococcoides sp. SA1]